MEALPSKSETERIIFAVDYGDELSVGSILSSAWIYVSVHSGDDDNPKRVYRRVFARIGTLVLYQVGGGLPGVVYNLETSITSGDLALTRNFKLAILPDSVDTGELYPLTRSVTTHPYAQIYYDLPIVTFENISGILKTVVVKGYLPDEFVICGMAPTGGSLYLPGTGTIDQSLVIGTLIATGGKLSAPPNGSAEPSNVVGTLIAYGGALFVPPNGTMSPSSTEASLVAIGGTLA